MGLTIEASEISCSRTVTMSCHPGLGFRAKGVGFRVEGSGFDISSLCSDVLPAVKSLRSSYTGLNPQRLEGKTSQGSGVSRGTTTCRGQARVGNQTNVQRFRGGLVVKAHRLVYHSTLGLRAIKKKKKGDQTLSIASLLFRASPLACWTMLKSSVPPCRVCVCVCVCVSERVSVCLCECVSECVCVRERGEVVADVAHDVPH